MMYRMQKLEQEHMFVILLNTRNKVIGEPVEVYHGTLNSTSIRVAELLRPAVRANAASIILLHNHPSGDPTASTEDVNITRSIVEAGKMLDTDVLDHIIIGQGRFVSLKGKGLGFDQVRYGKRETEGFTRGGLIAPHPNLKYVFEVITFYKGFYNVYQALLKDPGGLYSVLSSHKGIRYTGKIVFF